LYWLLGSRLTPRAHAIAALRSPNSWSRISASHPEFMSVHQKDYLQLRASRRLPGNQRPGGFATEELGGITRTSDITARRRGASLRWTLGVNTANPGDSTSWNRYAYVQGDPVSHTDRHGLFLDAEQCLAGPDACLAEDADCEGYGSGFDFLGSPGWPDPSCPVGPTPPAPPAPPPPTVSLREVSACTEAQGQLTGNITLDVTYQLVVNGAAVTGGNNQMSSLGIYYISEQLANETGGVVGTAPGAWCQSQAAGASPAPGDLGELKLQWDLQRLPFRARHPHTVVLSGRQWCPATGGVSPVAGICRPAPTLYNAEQHL